MVCLAERADGEIDLCWCRWVNSFDNTRIVFRLTNVSDSRLIVYGSEAGGRFRPDGYLLRFDAKKRKFVYPTTSGKPIAWALESPSYKDKTTFNRMSN